MQESDTYYPSERNLGRACSFWNLGGAALQCCFPKMELEGRTTCGGIIDDVCLKIKDGRPAGNTTELLLAGIKTQLPNSSLLPPGEII